MSPPPPLMEELVKEILLRLPPQDPASLVYAALVCKPWRRLVADPRFRRRFLEFHRTHPMLGFFCNEFPKGCSFVRTGTAAAASPQRHAKSPHWIVMDARHGRVVFWDNVGRRGVLELMVWDPITDEQRWLPVPPRPAISNTTAVLCVGAGDCNHFDCHRGPFLVVLVGIEEPGKMFVCTYSSDAAAWSDPIPTQHPDGCYNQAGYSPGVLLGNSLYFGSLSSSLALKFDLELREVSWVQLPVLRNFLQCSVLTTTEDGGLGLVTTDYSGGAYKLCVWRLRKDTPKANAGWTQSKAIDLWRLLPVGSISTVVGFANGLDIVFVKEHVDGALYTIDLKTYMAKKVYRGTGVHRVFPYTSFCLPALKAACLDEESSVAGSSA